MAALFDIEYLGHELLKEGFETWFRYLFRVIEQRDFIVEPIHPDLFQTFDDIIKGYSTRQNINIPPRSAKTTLAKYLIAYALTLNPKCNFIYTSYSQDLLKQIARELASILEHPIYKAMYPKNFVASEDIEADPVDEFWKDYLEKTTGKSTYTTKKIITYAGGTILFSSIGAQITGFGAGCREAKEFSGALIIDDANKPSEARSATLRDKVVRFYEETLLSRLNSSNVPIVNIQQRLHVEDLSAVLEKKYNFNTLKKPLLDENGVCQIPSQYTPERIKELQANNYMFQAQFQQSPILDGGNVIKGDWFNYYPIDRNFTYKRIIIAADTAMKTKEHNDYSVFGVGGITDNNHLHILDWMRGKWEAPELEKMAVAIWNKFKVNSKTGLMCNGLYIEDKASGTGLIQSLKTKYSIPVFGVQVPTDKLTRTEDTLPYIQSGYVFLPENTNYAFNPELLAECEQFSRDMSHKHDDQVDTLNILIKEGLSQNVVSFLDFFRT